MLHVLDTYCENKHSYSKIVFVSAKTTPKTRTTIGPPLLSRGTCSFNISILQKMLMSRLLTRIVPGASTRSPGTNGCQRCFEPEEVL